MRAQILGYGALIVAVFYLLSDPVGAAGTAKAIANALIQFAKALSA